MVRKGYGLFLWILNSIGLVGTIGINALANALPLNGRNTGELSDSIPNLFVPFGTTFAIWGLIYLLLCVFVIYLIVDWKRGGEAAQKLGLWFFLSCIANALWIITWHWQLLILSLVVMVFLLVSLIIMHTKTRDSSLSLGFRMAISMPISVYLGWITVATIANVTSVLVVYAWNRFGLSEEIWTIAVIIVAIIVNMLAVIIRGDIWFALVGVWALFGIYQKRLLAIEGQIPSIILTTIIGMIAIGCVIVVHLIVKGRKVAKEES